MLAATVGCAAVSGKAAWGTAFAEPANPVGWATGLGGEMRCAAALLKLSVAASPRLQNLARLRCLNVFRFAVLFAVVMDRSLLTIGLIVGTRPRKGSVQFHYQLAFCPLSCLNWAPK
ncbi:MAG: hypothetical protein Rhims3KO_30730 [Hyphomicrobiales bacterium]